MLSISLNCVKSSILKPQVAVITGMACNIRLFSLNKNADQAKVAVISGWLYYPWHY